MTRKSELDILAQPGCSVEQSQLDVRSFYFPGGPVGCLLLHGFSGNVLEVRGLGEHLAAQGYTVRGPLLPGHGASLEEMIATGRHDWLHSAEAELQRLQRACQAVFVAGLSMGGAISLILASRHPVAGVISMSTPAPLQRWQVRTLLVLRRFLRWLPWIGWRPGLTASQGARRLLACGRLPVAPVVELARLIGRLPYVLPQVRAPVLIMQGLRDRAIAPTSAQFIHDQLGSVDKTLRFLPNSGHNIAMGSERETVWRMVAEFIARVGGSGTDPRIGTNLRE